MIDLSRAKFFTLILIYDFIGKMMSKSFKIRDIVAEEGTKVTGFLTIEDDTAATVKLLIGIIKGSEEGPVLSITGGMYGTQYPGIDACIRTYNEIDSEKLKGTVITIPVIEMTGFQKCMDKSSIDGLSPNSVFPGDPEGTITYRIAYTVFNEVIKKSDYHIDLRGGDLWENLHTFSISCETGNKNFDVKTSTLARILGTKYYLIIPYIKGSLIGEASKLGIASVILESSKGLGTYDEEDIQSCMKSIYNLLKHLNMIKGKPDIPYEPKKIEFKMHHIKAKHGGLLYLQCKYGEVASKGQKLGDIRNLKGEILQELIAPIDGIIHYTYPKHIKHPGDLILGMRRILE